jgi:hypothetical protein
MPTKTAKPAAVSPSKQKEARRARYHSDAAHREKLRAQAREAMRKLRDQEDKDCRTNLRSLQTFGATRVCIIAGEPHTRMTFTVPEMADALLMSVGRLRVWIRGDMFPAPAVDADLGNGQRVGVYLLEEARVLVKAIGAHQQVSRHLVQERHQDVIDHLHAATRTMRRNTGVTG